MISYFVIARKTEIIRSTELLLEAINNSDFESYAYDIHSLISIRGHPALTSLIQ